MLNWIICIRTVWQKINSIITDLFEIELSLTLKLCSLWTELFDLKLFSHLADGEQNLYLY